MKKSLICLLVLALFLLSNTVLATNWVYVGRVVYEDHLYDGNVYVDSATAVKNDDTIVYWALVIHDRTISGVTLPNNPFLGSNYEPNDTKKGLWKWEVKLTNPRVWHQSECIVYDASGQEIGRNVTPGNWYQFNTGSIWDLEVDSVLKYTKEAEDTGQIPDISQAPQN